MADEEYQQKLDLTKQRLKILSDYLRCLTTNDIPKDGHSSLKGVKQFIEENLSSDEIDLPLILNFIPNMRALMNSVVTDDLDAAISRKKMEKKDLAVQTLETIRNDLTDLNNIKNNYQDISLNQYRKKTVDSPLEKTKANIVGFVFILIFVGFIILTAKYSNNVIAFSIFLFLVSIPLIIIYRRKLTKLLPIKLGDDVAKSVSEAGRSVDQIGSSKGMKQILCIILIIVCQIIAVVLLKNNRKKYVGLMMTVAFLIVAGVLTTELDKI